MFIAAPADTVERERLFQSSLDTQGFVMNLTRIWAWRPEVYDGFATLRNQLTGASTLSKRELAILVCAAAAERGDAYCSLAWGRTLVQEAGAGATAAVIEGHASEDLSARERALAHWARTVVRDPGRTTAADVQALRSAGISEREIVEAKLFIAFRLAFSTVNAALGASPDQQLAGQLPPDVLKAVSFGRPMAQA